MPKIYLSPSVQDYNPTILGVSEEYLMNLVADAMIPYLDASGIEYVRNSPNATLAQVISQSNAGSYDLHLSLHSNAAPDNLIGILRGPDIYYYSYSDTGAMASYIFADNLKAIYPNPDLVTVIPTTTLAELSRTRATAVLVELAYHDEINDASWIYDNLDLIARNLVLSLTEYFGIVFVNPFEY